MQHEGDTLDIAELPPEVIGARHGLRHQRGVEVAAEGMDSLGGVGYKSPVEDVTVDGDTGEHCGAGGGGETRRAQCVVSFDAPSV